MHVKEDIHLLLGNPGKSHCGGLNCPLLCHIFSFFFSYMHAIYSALNGGRVVGVWIETINSLLNKSPQPKCKPLQTSIAWFPWLLRHVLVELIALAIYYLFNIFVPSQTGGFIGFLFGCIWLTAYPGWTEMTVCPLCLEHDLALATLSLASHWSFGPTSDCVFAYLCVWWRQRRPLMWSQEAGGPEIQPDCVNNLWQVTFKGKQEYI